MEKHWKRLRKGEPHKETPGATALEGREPLHSESTKELLQGTPGKVEHLVRESTGNCAGKQDRKRNAKHPKLPALMERRTDKGNSMQRHEELSKQLWRRRRRLKREVGEKTLKPAEQDGRAPPGPRPGLQARWDKLLERKVITPERLVTENCEHLYGLRGDRREAAAPKRKRAPLFRAKWMKGKRKMQVMVASEWVSVLWRRELWVLAKATKSAVDSWSA